MENKLGRWGVEGRTPLWLSRARNNLSSLSCPSGQVLTESYIPTSYFQLGK
jgi:hypothetical protein